MPKRWLVAAAVSVLALFSVARPALAGSPALARQLTDLGIDAQQREDHVAALAYFDRALKELSHPKIRYFRAKSLRATGLLDDALSEFRAIQDDADVEKYRSEIVAFILAIESERERRLLEQQLERERRERERLEGDKKRLEEEARQAALERQAAEERARRAAEEAQRAADDLARRRAVPGPLAPDPARGPLAPDPSKGPLPTEPARGPLPTGDAEPGDPFADDAMPPISALPPRPYSGAASVEPDVQSWREDDVEPGAGRQASVAAPAPAPAETAYDKRLRRYDRRRIVARTFVTTGVLALAAGILIVANPFDSAKLRDSDVAPKAGKGLIGTGAVVLVAGLMMWPRRPVAPQAPGASDAGAPTPRGPAVSLTPVVGQRSGGLLFNASF
jgi:tetratricopeptide (TPR) repeat protein